MQNINNNTQMGRVELDQTRASELDRMCEHYDHEIREAYQHMRSRIESLSDTSEM